MDGHVQVMRNLDFFSKNIFFRILDLVVSIGVNHTFKVISTPLEYVPTMSKDSTFLVRDFFSLILRHQYLFCTFQAKRGSATEKTKKP